MKNKLCRDSEAAFINKKQKYEIEFSNLTCEYRNYNIYFRKKEERKRCNRTCFFTQISLSFYS